ncbi:MAG: sigma-70 family RNA polymerase sigma factor [Muribaculaceae bacterium]|nr:sigma-70 family RNA polymerase sigma factor [Muribaculaceae bacterium]
MTNKKHIEKLFKEHYRQLHRLAKMLLHDDELACDIVHDVFAALLYNANDDEISAGYLINAVRNRCINYIRNTSTRQRLANLYYIDSEEYDMETWPNDEDITVIYDIINSDLTPQCRRAMVLRFVNGMKFSEVANEMGISENAVYKYVRHAIVIIRKKLNQNG